jgi:hypothetical protein
LNKTIIKGVIKGVIKAISKAVSKTYLFLGIKVEKYKYP